jgi:tRNA (mo5U34)-methyltransferase
MLFHQRICLAVARHGISGLPRRLVRKITNADRREAQERAGGLAAAKASYERIVEAFNTRISQLGLDHLRAYYWYHTIDLGDGLITPGDYDYRDLLPTYGFPADMRGMTVLDVGSATGFFAFEFEKRGARVVSVELPSIADWDMVQSDREKTFAKLRLHPAETLDEVHQRHLEGPFQFCHRTLHSKVERRHSRVYDLTPEKLGVEAFDLIFVGDVLGHLFSPLQALNVLAPLCRGAMIISLDVMRIPTNPLYPESLPTMYYLGGSKEDGGRSWWIPDRACLYQMLDKVGFRSVEIAGEHTCLVRRCWLPSHRAIYHAKK